MEKDKLINICSSKKPLNSNFHFIVPVWGKSFTKLFTDICLPMLLTPGNLQFFKGDESALFVIVTTWEASNIIRQSEAYQRLEKIISVRLWLMDGMEDISSTHQRMTNFYQFAMQSKDVKKGKTSFVFLTPDSFWSDGTFRRLFELRGLDYFVVMVTGLRLNKDDMLPILNRCIKNREKRGVYDNHELVGIALKNLHQMSQAHNILGGNTFLNQWPSNIYWKVSGEQMVAHCFHMHPLLVKSKRGKIGVTTTIDGDMLEKLNYPLNKYYIVQDSDEAIGLELSDNDRSWNQPVGAPNMKSIKHFAITHCNRLHWHFFSHRIIYHSGGKIPDEVENLISREVKEVQRVRLRSLIVYPAFVFKTNGFMRHVRKFIVGCLRLPLRVLRKLNRMVHQG